MRGKTKIGIRELKKEQGRQGREKEVREVGECMKNVGKGRN